MYKKVLAKYGYEEVLINNSTLKKLYYIYLHQTLFDKILDILVFLAIIISLGEILSELFFNLNQHILHYLHIISIGVLIIFTIELFREYAQSKTNRHFFKKHWMDLALVIFLSTYFFTAAYFGIGKIKAVSNFAKYTGKFKQIKASLKLFGN